MRGARSRTRLHTGVGRVPLAKRETGPLPCEVQVAVGIGSTGVPEKPRRVPDRPGGIASCGAVSPRPLPVDPRGGAVHAVVGAARGQAGWADAAEFNGSSNAYRVSLDTGG